MTRFPNRRVVLQTGLGLSMTSLLPMPLWALALDDIPRSEFGAQTTCDEVAAGRDLTGLTVLITGCNSGLGFESMRTLAGQGAHVIGTARTQAKADEACAAVEGKTTPLVCELTDMDSVAACAEATLALDKPIDVLMCNAGIMALPKLEQVDVAGVTLEKQFVVNHLGHYLLIRLLLPRVAMAEAPRVVMLSSSGYALAPQDVGIEFDNLSGSRKYSAFKAYGQTKLSNALIAKEITRRYADNRLTANAVHPGLVATNLGRYISGKPRDPNEPLRKGFKTADQGAATQVYCAIDPRLDGVSGFYFEDCNPSAMKGNHANDPVLAQNLWNVSAELVSDWL